MHYITLTIRPVYTFMKKGGNPPTQIFQKKNNNSVLLIHWEKKTHELSLLKIHRQSLHLLSTSRVILTAKGMYMLYKRKEMIYCTIDIAVCW